MWRAWGSKRKQRELYSLDVTVAEDVEISGCTGTVNSSWLPWRSERVQLCKKTRLAETGNKSPEKNFL